MTKLPTFHLVKLLFVFFPFVNIAQSYPVPKITQFAGITIAISNDAQTIIQDDIKNLMSNQTYLNTKLDLVSLYFPIIEPILANEGVPDDFKYLCVQESGLLPDAVSKSNAVGFWQFKRETALDFGLRIDEKIDERKNIHASTRVACLYLKRNFQVLNNWISALNSYRTGLSNVYKFIPKEWYGSHKISITAKTDFYVLRAIAHKMVFEKEIAKHKTSDLSFFEYPFNAGKSISVIAKELNVSEDNILKYNRWLNVQFVPEDKPYKMVISFSKNEVKPIKEKVLLMNGMADDLQEDWGFKVLSRITPKTKNKNTPIFFDINNKAGIQAISGDDVKSICARADFDVEDFLKYNDLTDGLDSKIIPNEIYYLQKKGKKAFVPFHTVTNVREQTLWKISQRYGISLDKLLKYNRLETSQLLTEGRVLWLQKTRPTDISIEEIVIQKTVPRRPMEVITQMTKNYRLQKDETKILDLTSTKALREVSIPIIKEDVISQNSDTEGFKPNIPIQIHEVNNYMHTVKIGENFYSIARRYNISVNDVWTWNKMNKDVKLEIGKKLFIKFGHYYAPLAGGLAQGAK